MKDLVIEKIWLTDTAVWVRTVDGREACERFSDYPRLKWATPEQRAAYVADPFGLHWEELDEDLSFEGFFQEKKDNCLYELFLSHPELNASAVARRLGISQSLFARYISGVKNPSARRLEEILEVVRTIGKELAAV